jgi:hypothetical protein
MRIGANSRGEMGAILSWQPFCATEPEISA